MGVDWPTERPLIEAECQLRNVDVAFIMAIRQIENGGPGKEFGVLSVSAPTYADQLRICVSTVAHRLESYTVNPLTRNPFGRVTYNPKWIAYFAAIWAPGGVQNDPNGLNKNWLPNVLKAYTEHQNGSI